SLAIAYFVACAFVALNLVVDFVQRYVQRRTGRSFSARLRWQGARVVHLGALLMFVGIAGSSGFEVQKQVATKMDEILAPKPVATKVATKPVLERVV
ncbi:MAG: hypothetical protein LAQ30_11345, partial [Acidobacteriia bacterium]|nr:hypothetical protein [Terriglobia bacterium]